MTYETGIWYGWNGGECPVHPGTVVEGMYDDPETGMTESRSPVTDVAWKFDWNRKLAFNLVAFRIITPYVEPRKPKEVWLKVEDVLGVKVFSYSDEYHPGAILYREVLPE